MESVCRSIIQVKGLIATVHQGPSTGAGSFDPLGIRHAVWFVCSEPSGLVQLIQLNQHKRLATDFASA
jgi:hypothetical protein